MRFDEAETTMIGEALAADWQDAIYAKMKTLNSDFLADRGFSSL